MPSMSIYEYCQVAHSLFVYSGLLYEPFHSNRYRNFSVFRDLPNIDKISDMFIFLVGSKNIGSPCKCEGAVSDGGEDEFH